MIFAALTAFAVFAVQSQNESVNSKILNLGLGVGHNVLYDASFSLVRQTGIGPSMYASFQYNRQKSIHLFENSLSLLKFKSEVTNPNYALKGENLHERFNYTYLRTVGNKRLTFSLGSAIGFDFSKIKPEGLVINNAPLHDFNLQLQLATKVQYQFEVFKKKWAFSYRLYLPFLAYNSRPDFLGFTEFSGKSKYFNNNANFATMGKNYFYLNQNFQLVLNTNTKNSFSIQNIGYYAHNNLSNLHQNLTNIFLVTYTRKLSTNKITQ